MALRGIILEGDPYEILGLGPDAGDRELRQAYLSKVKEHPPDRSPEEFERIRDAYELLKDPVMRVRRMLKSTDPFAPLVDHLVVKGSPPGQEWAEAEEANGNADGLFTRVAAERGIPITYIARTLEAVDALKQLFGIEAGQ